MSKISCELLSKSNMPHLQQIYTGFSILHDAGIIRLNQKVVRENLFDETKPPHLRDARENHLKVVINREITVYYDTHDGFEIDAEEAAQTDFYFKRSYSPGFISSLPERSKIFPLGLNYLVYGAGRDPFLLARHALFRSLRDKADVFVRALKLEPYLLNRIDTPRLDKMHLPPDLGTEPRVLFMARAWNPSISPDAEIRGQIESINEMRADCVRRLKKEFKSRFFGGLAHDEYAREKFPDCLLPDGSLARQRIYLQTLREFPVCVATTGLLGSIGWKLAEYVAFSKAIVSEPLNYTIPGDFQKEKNYLEFDSSEQCVASVARLFDDSELRNQMMQNNDRYYNAYLKPDTLVLNTLSIALGHN